MSTYWIFANKSKKVYMEPNDVVPGTARALQVIGEPEVTSLLTWALMGPWRGDHVVALADSGATSREYEEVGSEWRNVTAQLNSMRASEAP